MECVSPWTKVVVWASAVMHVVVDVLVLEAAGDRSSDVLYCQLLVHSAVLWCRVVLTLHAVCLIMCTCSTQLLSAMTFYLLLFWSPPVQYKLVLNTGSTNTGVTGHVQCSTYSDPDVMLVLPTTGTVCSGSAVCVCWGREYTHAVVVLSVCVGGGSTHMQW